MGPWSVFTHRRFRWSELRFETRFATPHIRMGVAVDEEFPLPKNQSPLLLSPTDARKMIVHHSDSESIEDESKEQVC